MTLPSSVTSIDSQAFYGCTNLAAINIADGNEHYASRDGVLFSGDMKTLLYCPPVKSGAFAIPNGVTTIDDNAFNDCQKLTAVTIPNSVTAIGRQAFYQCRKLAGVYIDDLAAWCAIAFSDQFANPLYYANRLYLNGSQLTDLVIPGSPASIGSYTFCGLSTLKSVTIPGDVSFARHAFYGCRSLASATFRSGTNTISNNMFNNCSNLKTVTIPKSVTTISTNAFVLCKSLTDVYYTGTAEDYNGP